MRRPSPYLNLHLAVGLLSTIATAAWTSGPATTNSKRSFSLNASRLNAAAPKTTTSWFSASLPVVASSSAAAASTTKANKSLEQRKAILLQLGAALDRGQSYNPTSGDYYKDRMDVAVKEIDDFVAAAATSSNGGIPTSLDQIAGEWELVLSTVPHGIFRSSPFFLAIQEAYDTCGEGSKANLFFKLHELQTCSWGVSKIGRVAQHITVDSDNSNKGYLYSEFDTSIFSLTVIPILGWFKLLPTFGGCVVTAAKAELVNSKDGDNGATTAVLEMKVDYTTARKVPGLRGLGEWIWKVKVPVGAIWKLLPWNRGRDADCRVYVRYVDDDFRIVQDVSGDYFVYTRPVVPRPLDLAEDQQGSNNK